MTTVTSNPTQASSPGPQAHSLLRTQNLHRILGTGDTAAHILRGVNLDIAPRTYAAIVGASGSGKSTLLYLLGGLDRPSAGYTDKGGRYVRFDPPSAVFVDGENTADLGESDLALLRNEKIGFVFQFHYLLREFTAQENVMLPMRKSARWSRSEMHDRSAELLAKLGLGEKIPRRANRLSGGEQQRVAIARALANKPAALLADEPTGNLDKANSEVVAGIFEELAASGQTIIMVTHDQSFAARAKRKIVMEDGNVVSDVTRE